MRFHCLHLLNSMDNRPHTKRGETMNKIRDNYIKREAKYKAAQYLAEKEYERQQTADARRDFIIIAIGALLVASIIGSFLG